MSQRLSIEEHSKEIYCNCIFRPYHGYPSCYNNENPVVLLWECNLWAICIRSMCVHPCSCNNDVSISRSWLFISILHEQNSILSLPPLALYPLIPFGWRPRWWRWRKRIRCQDTHPHADKQEDEQRRNAYIHRWRWWWIRGAHQREPIRSRSFAGSTENGG